MCWFHLVSFEVDLSLIQFALENRHHFDHFIGYEHAIASLLNQQKWIDKNITWELVPGNFPDRIGKQEAFADLVYYDPYSPKVNSEMWTSSCFRKLRAHCKAHGRFYNYSQATPIRAALLEAGFFVGYGIPTGQKETTTQAACQLEDLDSPLGQRWFERWQRSSTPLPLECDDPERLKTVIRNHPQFQHLS